MAGAISRRQFLIGGLAAGAYTLIGPRADLFAASGSRKLNVLFIAVDDLRPELGCYGVPVIKTPNIDALAARGTLFDRAYCQQAVCSPSRTSLLTGKRPDTTRIYDLQTHFRGTIPDVITLPEHFKKNGYHAQALSKIYHGGLDDPQSWSVPSWRPDRPTYADPKTVAELAPIAKKLADEDAGFKVLETDPKTGLALKVRAGRRPMGPAWECCDVPDNYYADGATADHAIEDLRQIKDKPFFLAVGFLKPHLPFVAPKKYYDLYKESDLHLATNPFPPKDCPEYALAHWGELRAYRGMPKSGPVSDQQALELIHGYYAATSYTDAQVGRVIAELDRLGLRDNTVIVLWGDHGWQLGEHGEWCKHTNFEVACRSPLIISAPGQKHEGAKTENLAEFVDIYPTLCELCGLPAPDGLEGTSLVPVMEDPKRPWKKAAFSQFPRKGLMGHSIRTDRYRYTEWADHGEPPAARELYDHKIDPDENVNIANLPESKALVEELSKMLAAGWKGARPTP
jgi:iduronate 2-sulfatase